MTNASERRDGPRIDLRLRVRYRVDGSDAEAEASDVSPKGLRLESEVAVAVGTELKLHVDAGEAEEMEATGHVTWCRQHTSPTGKQVYDVGVRFESDWLAKDRGPLGSALARIFAMNHYEPARSFERTAVSLTARSTSPALELEIMDVSVGGMRMRSKGASLSDRVRDGVSVKVEIDCEGQHTILARVAWVAGGADSATVTTSGPRVNDSFGIEFPSLSGDQKSLLERVRTGQAHPTRVVLTLDRADGP